MFSLLAILASFAFLWAVVKVTAIAALWLAKRERRARKEPGLPSMLIGGKGITSSSIRNIDPVKDKYVVSQELGEMAREQARKMPDMFLAILITANEKGFSTRVNGLTADPDNHMEAAGLLMAAGRALLEPSLGGGNALKPVSMDPQTVS